jgi:hypothetical protein
MNRLESAVDVVSGVLLLVLLMGAVLGLGVVFYAAVTGQITYVCPR